MNTMRSMLLALLCGASAATWAQNAGEIHGKVLDDLGGALPFASVRAEQADAAFNTQADEEGRYILKPLPPGTYTVKISFAGMRTVEVAGVRVDPGLNNIMKDVVMLPQEIGGPIVIAYRWEEPLIRMDDPSRMVITTTQIKATPTRKNPVAMIAGITPGVTKAPNGDGLYFRGARSDAMYYFVDGVKMSTLTGVPPDAINSISVYTGGLPAKYGDVTGGVVAIETKSYFDLYQQRNSER